MKHLSLRGACMAAAVTVLTPACADGSSGDEREGHVRRQIEQFDERADAKRRDLQARCDDGDQRSCSDAVCMRLLTEGPSAVRYRECSSSRGFKTADRWVQFSPLLTSNDTQLSIHIVCLVEPEVLKIGGKEVRVFRQLQLEADTRHATAFHDRNRFYSDMMGGPDFATWESAADTLCNRGIRHK